MTAFELLAKITLDTSGYEKGLDDASGKTSSFASKLKSGLQTAAKVGAVAITAVTTATTAMTAALVKGVGQTASYGDNIDKMSQKLGISAEAYQEWDAIMQHCGSSIESLKPSMKTLANAAADPTDSTMAAFNKLGLSMEEVSSMSQEDLFSTVIARLQDMGESTERTAIASDLLGRAATELGPLFNSTSEETEAMRQRVHELGGVMSNEAVKAAAKYQDTLQDMKTAFSGVTRSITQEFLPGFTDVMDGITRLLTGEDSATVTELLDSGIGWISTALEKTIDRIVEMSKTVIPVMTTAIEELLPYLLEVGIHIIESLATAIVGAIPSLASSAVQIINSLATAIIGLLPTLFDAGGQMILTLISGLSQSIPQLLGMVPEIVVQLLSSLQTQLPLIAQAGIELLQNLADGFASNIPSLLEQILPMILSFTETLRENFGQIVDAGIDLILKLVDGLIEGLPTLIEYIPTIITNITGLINDNLPKIINAGITIIGKLVAGLIKAIPTIIANIPQIINAIVNTFTAFNWLNLGKSIITGLGNGLKSMVSFIKNIGSELIQAIKGGFSKLPSEMLNIGKNIVQGVWNGIKGMIGWFTSQVRNFFSSIVSSVKNALGIHSPSKVFAGIGEYMAEGLGEGWNKAYSDVERLIDKDMAFSGSISTSANSTNKATGGAGLAGANINIYVNGANIQDDQKLAEKIAFQFQMLIDREAMAVGA